MTDLMFLLGFFFIADPHLSLSVYESLYNSNRNVMENDGNVNKEVHVGFSLYEASTAYQIWLCSNCKPIEAMENIQRNETSPYYTLVLKSF